MFFRNIVNYVKPKHNLLCSFRNQSIMFSPNIINYVLCTNKEQWQGPKFKRVYDLFYLLPLLRLYFSERFTKLSPGALPPALTCTVLWIARKNTILNAVEDRSHHTHVWIKYLYNPNLKLEWPNLLLEWPNLLLYNPNSYVLLLAFVWYLLLIT